METKQGKGLKIFLAVITVLLAANLVVTGVMLSNQLGGSDTSSDEITRYTLYIGTNDKDTYKLEKDYDECKNTVMQICQEYTSGGTVADATGFWFDETGTVTNEKTIELILEGVTEDQVHSIADEVIKALNQNTVLIENQSVVSEYYASSEN